MVNRGRPSRDCLPCRRRKLRCDLRAGCCSQCKRAKLECHGYRDPRDLAFRDETLTTARKVSVRQIRTQGAVPAGLDLDWHVFSRHFFFTTYLDGFSRSHETLAPLYAKASKAQPLAASVDAVSLALTSFHFNRPLLMRRANERYIAAIQKLQQCLGVLSKSILSDEILQSTILLDMYEKLAHRSLQSQASWMSHIQGAMALLQARSDGHNFGLLASQLARRFIVSLTISCGAAGISVPGALSSLRRKLGTARVPDIKWSFTALLIDAINLRAQVHTTAGASSSRLAEDAKAVDSHLASLQSTIPLPWRPRRVYLVGDHPLVYGKHYDVYPDHFMMQTWNAIRMIRLEMIDIVRKHGPGHSVDAGETEHSNLIDSIARNICASVPQFVLPGLSPENQQNFSPLQLLRCYTLLTPLYLAAQLSSDADLKDWVIRSLRHMATAGRMRIAEEVANMLVTNPDVNYWAVYATVGSYAVSA